MGLEEICIKLPEKMKITDNYRPPQNQEANALDGPFAPDLPLLC